MIVVDATVLVDFLAGEKELKTSAQELAFEDSRWISVGLWRYEVGNVFLKLVRRKKESLDPSELGEILRDTRVLLIDSVDEVDPGGIWSIAVDSGLTYYDASYVWLAETRGLTLRTRDKEILEKFPHLARPMPR